MDAGGQNLHVAELSAGLVRLGFDVTVYTRRDDPHAAEVVRTPAGYRVVHVSAGPAKVLSKDSLLPYMPGFAQQLRRYWATETPDLVHAHFWMSGMAALSAAGPDRIPVLQTYHALGVVKRRHRRAEDSSPPQRIATERRLGRQAAGIIATCSDEVSELTRMGVPRDRIFVVPCGVNVDQFSPRPTRVGRGAAHRLVSVGRLVPHKGFAQTIEALQWLPDTELVIAGGPPRPELTEDPEARRLRELAARHGVADRLRLAGQVPRAELPGLLGSADVVVCSSWYESFGIVPLEAMACGIPVVAVAVGGLTDTVADKVTGLLVPPRQPRALASALRWLLASPADRARLGASGRRRATTRYTWDRVAADTAEVYRRFVPAELSLVTSGAST